MRAKKTHKYTHCASSLLFDEKKTHYCVECIMTFSLESKEVTRSQQETRKREEKKTRERKKKRETRQRKQLIYLYVH